MRIGVDCHVLNGKFQGSRTYLENLYPVVLKQNSNHEFIFFGNWNGIKPFGNDTVYVDYPSISRWRRLSIDAFTLIRKYGIDLYHTTYISPLKMNCRSLVTVHDVLFESNPEYFNRLFTFRSKYFVKRSVHKASQIHTISMYSKREIIDRYHISEKNVRLVVPGIDHQVYSAEMTDEARKIVFDMFGVEDYILSVGRIEPRKNYEGLLDAYAEVKRRGTKIGHLVIVGKNDFRFEGLYKKVEQLKLTQYVKIIDAGNTETLVNLYRASRLFVYPSFAEGFGLPVLEAMACGVPVITSNSTALPEVVGDAGLLIDPCDSMSIANAIIRIIENDSLRETLSQKAIAQSMKWSWDKSARQFHSSINDIQG